MVSKIVYLHEKRGYNEREATGGEDLSNEAHRLRSLEKGNFHKYGNDGIKK